MHLVFFCNTPFLFCAIGGTDHEDHTWEAFLEGEADDGSGTAPRQPELLEADDASTAEIEALGLKVVRVRSSAYAMPNLFG